MPNVIITCSIRLLSLFFMSFLLHVKIPTIRNTQYESPKLSSYSPNVHASMTAWFITHVNRNEKPQNGNRSEVFVMRKMGLEPTRHCWHKILSLACLPIPALPHVSYFSEVLMPHRRCKSYIITIGIICQQLF